MTPNEQAKVLTLIQERNKLKEENKQLKKIIQKLEEKNND